MMQPGVYYIGDLCYVFEDSDWDQLISVTQCADGEFVMPDGRYFAMYGTAYGDGTYRAPNGDSLGVDSGTIGCIRAQDIRADIDYGQLVRLGTIVEFEDKFETGAKDGMLKFGKVLINTSAD